MTRRAMTMKIGIAAVLALAGTVWALGGPENTPLAPPAGAAPVPRDDARGEGRIALWRDGHPITFTPGTKGTTPLGTGFEGKRGSLRLGRDGKLLVYIANRTTIRPSEHEKWDRVYLRDGTRTTEIEDFLISMCHAFWSADGTVYGYGLIVLPRWGNPETPPDLTTDFVNWSFDPRTGKVKRLKLPGNVSVLDISPDGKAFLVLQYERPKPAGEAPKRADPPAPEVYRLGSIPADGGEFVPLTKVGELTPGDFRFSPDGRSALGTMYRTEGTDLFPVLTAFDLKTNKRTAVAVPKDARVRASCWSPDGKRVAYVWESQAAYAERNKNGEGPVVPGREKKPVSTVTVANPDGSDAKDVYTETEYRYGSIDWAAPRRDDPPRKSEPGVGKPDDEASVAAHIKALRDADSKTRSDAAEALRRIVAKYPSGTVYLAKKDGGESAWREKVDQVKPGMTKEEVLKILPAFQEKAESSEVGSGDSHIVSYRLDYHWVVTVSYRNPDKVIERPTLTRRALRIDVEPPKDFTGAWTTWHVNGQKGHETQYKNGKYDGVLTSYHDNGSKSYEQHYADHVVHGADTGWFPDGKVSYTARYKNGKQDGTWTHWYANGNKHSETNYADGKHHGSDTRWHENGQIAGVNDYRDGVKHGVEASWDEKGVLQYERVFENGKLID